MKQGQATSWLYFCTLAPSLPLFAYFAIHSLLAVLLCHLVRMEEGAFGNTTVISNSSESYTNIWVGEARGTTDVN